MRLPTVLGLALLGLTAAAPAGYAVFSPAAPDAAPAAAAAAAPQMAAPLTAARDVPPPSNPVQGRKHFISHNCYGCHGGLAGGGMGPNLRDVVKKIGPDNTHHIVLHGRPNMGMPDWEKHGVTSDEAWIIESYLASLGTPREPKFFIGWKQR